MGRSMDKVWENIHASREWGQYPSEQVIRFVAHNYYKADRQQIRILDFGCGGGANTWYLAREGFDTYAFDGSSNAITKVKEKLEKEELYANIRVRDGKEIDYRENFFDAIIDSACIYSNRLADIEDMYKSAYRVLKPGGRLLSIAFTSSTTGYGEGIELEEGTYTDIPVGSLKGLGIVHFWKMNEMENLLSNIGYINICTEYYTREAEGFSVQNIVVSAEKKKISV